MYLLPKSSEMMYLFVIASVYLKPFGNESTSWVFNKLPLTLSKGEFTVKGRLISKEKRIAKIKCSLFDGEGVEYAKAQISYFHFPERAAKERYHYPGIEAFTRNIFLN